MEVKVKLPLTLRLPQMNPARPFRPGLIEKRRREPGQGLPEKKQMMQKEQLFELNLTELKLNAGREVMLPSTIQT